MSAIARITAESIKVARLRANTHAQILRHIGVSPTSLNYARLERVARENGLQLPAKANHGKTGPRPDRRTSPMWDEMRLREAVASAGSISEVLATLGLPENARQRLRVAADSFGIVLPEGRRLGSPRMQERRRVAMARVFVKGERRIKGELLKRYILDAKLMVYRCGSCPLGSEWNGHPLVLQIDHINGDATDNRLENLRLLCPNCHSQTETFAGRNRRPAMGNGVTRQHA